jgi:hypothetical protein
MPGLGIQMSLENLGKCSELKTCCGGDDGVSDNISGPLQGARQRRASL